MTASSFGLLSLVALSSDVTLSVKRGMRTARTFDGSFATLLRARSFLKTPQRHAASPTEATGRRGVLTTLRSLNKQARLVFALSAASDQLRGSRGAGVQQVQVFMYRTFDMMLWHIQ